ncbi:MAG: hypothetical protein V3U68_01510 [Bacteroidota bacterium]
MMTVSVAIFIPVALWFAGTVDRTESSVNKVRGMEMPTFAVIVVFALLTTLGTPILLDALLRIAASAS